VGASCTSQGSQISAAPPLAPPRSPNTLLGRPSGPSSLGGGGESGGEECASESLCGNDGGDGVLECYDDRLGSPYGETKERT